MLADPTNYTPEDPVLVFDQIVQTCSVMAYCQSYVANINVTQQSLALLEKSLEIRLSLARERLDSNGQPMPPPIMVEELTPPKISQLVHFKLILTTLAKDRKGQVQKKRHEHKATCSRIAKLIHELMLAMRRGHIKNPVKRAAIVGNYCQIVRAFTQLEYFEGNERILKHLKKLTSQDYGKNIKARDFAEIV
jgi:hypothetical protein